MTVTNEARIENCTLCNYSCTFCPHSTTFSRKKEVMSFELFSEILNKLKIEAPQITDVTISGFGEPFLDKGLLNKIRHAREEGYKIHIVTNGSLLTKMIIEELIELEVSDIRISFHSANSKEYEKLTGANIQKWAHTLTNIYYISELKTNNTRLIITADIINNYDKEVKNLRNLLEDKIDLLEVWKPHNWVNWGNYREGEKVKQTCGRPFNGPLQIQVDGTVNMCCFDYNGELKLGDFKTQTLNEIFSSDMYKRIFTFHNGEEIDDLICKNCDQLKNVGSVIYYNNGFTEEERINTLSTSYEKL